MRKDIPPPCGTSAGYQWHHKRNQQPCAACTEANRDYHAWQRFRSGAQRRPWSCKGCGSVFPDHACAMGGGS